MKNSKNVLIHDIWNNYMDSHFPKIENPDVAAVFNSYPSKITGKLLYLRQVIFETANAISEVGEIEETLKWGEPSYLTPKTKSGSTIRINQVKDNNTEYAIYFKCTANIVEAFREKFPMEFTYGGNRCIIFQLNDEIPLRKLKLCIAMALTYHLNKKLDSKHRWIMMENYLS